MAAFPFKHLRQNQFAQNHGRFQIHAEHSINIFIAEFVIDRGEFHARVVDENVSWAELLSDVLKQLAALNHIAQIARDGDGFSALILNLLSEFFEVLPDRKSTRLNSSHANI